jgi:hypothetical protein
MIPYLNELLRDFPELIGAIATSPAADHLFKVRPEGEARLLPEEQAISFHHFVARLLFMSSRARRDIQVAVAFLTTRVKAPDEDDWGKLKRVLKYLKGTRGLKLTLSVDDMSIIKWWIDASYATHEDCKGHRGALMSLGKGAVTSTSNKHKIQGRSSTDDELIGVHDTLPQVLWTKYFIEAQGYHIKRNEVHQDNKSAQLLETNGRLSAGKGMKHIKNRYFFVHDQVVQGNIDIVHSPAVAPFPEDRMWADVLTKPKSGRLFWEDRSVLMNCPVHYVDNGEFDEDSDENKPEAFVFAKIGGSRINVR